MAAPPKDPMRFGLATAAAIVAMDQISKAGILEIFGGRPDTIEVTSFFNLVLTWNRGVSFGMFNEAGAWNVWVFTAIAVVIVAVLLYWLKRADTWTAVVAYGAIIGGALGNVVDRLRFGAVVDFLDFHVAGTHWPAFNVADAAIVVGAGLVVIDSLMSARESR